jgi:hypothetical protein
MYQSFFIKMGVGGTRSNTLFASFGCVSVLPYNSKPLQNQICKGCLDHFAKKIV